MPTHEGLFKLDITDHHAVLGFSLAADPKQVRKRYLQIARQLHPDSLREASEAQKKLASDLLSKQVNPAYEALTQEKSAKEHSILLKMKQQQLVTRPILLSAKSESAKKLLGTSNLEMDYTSAVNHIAKDQFDDLTRVDSAINELSELNAVFLMRKGSVGEKKGRSAGDVAKPSEPAEAAPRRPKHEAIIESYLSRAKEFAYKRDYSRAILELREAIAAHPQSASCHSYLASLYLQANQATLAKIHAKQALVFDEDNDMAKEVQAKLGAKAAKAAPAKAAGAKKGGGLLSGLFSKKR
ncbi:MAG: molecular chaperone DnaJ [Leptolyngbya foveolarum]|uniref:Molecular chaperone DnaJ n=1 Tax=Leptolyngbya foveolarum TaxID=47253 RepID=A0A2W4TUY7_9CYAN|nr:MAG: molecular chaperone DnaJ [Leptolyngbya foveolarum]